MKSLSSALKPERLVRAARRLGLMPGGKPLKIAISANCQGTPLGQLITTMCDGVEISHITIVHKARDDASAEDLAAFKAADIILAQKVADNYPCEYVRTNALRERFGDKVLSWVNLYFSGYNPELTYMRGDDRTPMNGPLGDYHLRPVITAYQDGLSVEDALARLRDPDYNATHYSGAAKASMDELHRRDEDTNIKIADFVERRLPIAKQFHTFNHPSLDLLTELAARCAHAMGRDVSRRPSPGMLPEPLGMIMAPINPQARLEMGFPEDFDPVTYKGTPLDWSQPRPTRQPGHALYSMTEVIEAFYRRYDIDREAVLAFEAHPES